MDPLATTVGNAGPACRISGSEVHALDSRLVSQGVGRSEAASERVAAHLRRAILNGEIPPGTKIRQEEVAEQLGASRLPVREALRMLEAEGLTQLEVNKGARVPAFDRDELEVIYEMRERIETLALRMSLPFLAPEQEAELHDLQDRIEATTDVST